MNVPDDRSYTDQHEWVMQEGEQVRIGITDYAQDALGDIVYVDLPDAGAKFGLDETLAEVESTKSVGEVYAPIAGTVVAANSILADAPETINSDPYGAGWIVTLAPESADPLQGMLDAAAYSALIA